jgi:cell envelope opacity-associated protein A
MSTGKITPYQVRAEVTVSRLVRGEGLPVEDVYARMYVVEGFDELVGALTVANHLIRDLARNPITLHLRG